MQESFQALMRKVRWEQAEHVAQRLNSDLLMMQGWRACWTRRWATWHSEPQSCRKWLAYQRWHRGLCRGFWCSWRCEAPRFRGFWPRKQHTPGRFVTGPVIKLAWMIPRYWHRYFWCCGWRKNFVAWTVISFAVCLNLSQLPGQIDAFGVEERGQSQQRQNYAALNEQLLSQLNYQLADSDKKVFHLHLCDAFTWNRMHICILTRLVLIAVVVEMILFNVVVLTNYNYLRLQLDEIGRRFTGVGGSLQLLSREVAVMTKKLEQLLQQ